MAKDQDSGTVQNGAKELTKDEARKKREAFLALNDKDELPDDDEQADSAIATFILPGD